MPVTLSNEEIARYSRQLIIEELGPKSQIHLKSTSVLIVGCGGLGCPASLYLAAAGIGKLGLNDGDTVEISNLHRQVLHTTDSIDKPKTSSARERLLALNPNVEIEEINQRITAENAIEIVKRFDIVVDATDNALTRYLVNDACVITGKPLVSGAALRFEGQHTLYNYRQDPDSPCYRCIFPQPPPAETVTNCSDGGVLGVIPGIIGSLQALEVLKLAAKLEPSHSGSMLLFDGLRGQFKTVTLRKRRIDCAVCGQKPTVKEPLTSFDYHAFVPVCAQSLRILDSSERITCKEFQEIRNSGRDYILIDVRPAIQHEIVHLDESKSIPLKILTDGDGVEKLKKLVDEKPKVREVYVICRRGNASQKAVRYIKENKILDNLEFKDIIGGIIDWSKSVDPKVPIY